jgi:hypothetical protein
MEKANKLDIQGVVEVIFDDASRIQELVVSENLDKEQLIQALHALESIARQATLLLQEPEAAMDPEERRLRDLVIRLAMQGRGVQELTAIHAISPATKIVAMICDSFLSDEFDAEGISGIENPRERIEAIDVLVQRICLGIRVERIGDVESDRQLKASNTQVPRQRYAGYLLKQLIGKHGMVDRVALACASGEYNMMLSGYEGQEVYARAINCGIVRYLRTFNLICSIAVGVKHEHRRNDLLNCTRSLPDVKKDLQKYWRVVHYQFAREGCIVPVEGNNETAEATMIRARFEQDTAVAAAIEQGMVKVIIEEHEDRVRYLETQEAELQAKLAKAEELKSQVSQAPHLDHLGRALGETQHSLAEARGFHNNNSRERQKLGTPGRFAFRKKSFAKALDLAIVGYGRRINQLEREVHEIEVAIEEKKRLYEELRKIDTWKLSGEINRLRREKEQITAAIQSLEAALEPQA